MKIDDLKKFLCDEISVVDFMKSISIELRNFILGYRGKKDVLKVVVMESPTVVQISINDLIKIMDNYLNNNLLEWDLTYICSCIDMSQSILYENEIVEDIVFYISDPVVNFPISKIRIESYKKLALGLRDDLNKKMPVIKNYRESYMSILDLSEYNSN